MNQAFVMYWHVCELWYLFGIRQLLIFFPVSDGEVVTGYVVFVIFLAIISC